MTILCIHTFQSARKKKNQATQTSKLKYYFVLFEPQMSLYIQKPVQMLLKSTARAITFNPNKIVMPFTKEKSLALQET